jgi:hypothetical protein
MTTETTGLRLRRVTGALFLIGALSFAAAATVLSATFNWPDILREPPDVVDLAGLVGSTGWGLWVAALGVTLMLRPKATVT